MFERFKTRWEINKNWQLLFPVLGIIAVFYLGFKFSFILKDIHLIIRILISLLLGIVLTKFFLFLFKRLESKWKINYKWRMIRIFMVFALTGSSSLFIGRPLMKYIGITKENLIPILYWFLYIFIGLLFYQILLVTYGWLFGEHKFFWEFEKKMFKRFGLGRLFK